MQSNLKNFNSSVEFIRHHGHEQRPASVLTDSIANYLHGVEESEIRSRTGLLHSKSALDIQGKNVARKNIKTNTKQLKGEINSIEM